jgi:hypothetical protein
MDNSFIMHTKRGLFFGPKKVLEKRIDWFYGEKMKLDMMKDNFV